MKAIVPLLVAAPRRAVWLGGWKGRWGRQRRQQWRLQRHRQRRAGDLEDGDGRRISGHPSFTGGAIADGTYTLTAMLNYATATAPSGTRKETFLVAGNQLNAAFSVDGSAEARYTATLEMHVGAPFELTLNVSCTAPDVSGLISTFYEATATDLRIGTDLMEISTYTKQ